MVIGNTAPPTPIVEPATTTPALGACQGSVVLAGLMTQRANRSAATLCGVNSKTMLRSG
jgi:hypothetical protein